jgi:hypothetical protein
MDYFLQGFSIFLGVIAGTAVTILTQRFLLWREETQKIANLKFEIQFNIRQVDRWMEYLVGYRNAVNGDAISSWAEYFDFSHIIKSTIENMIQSGLIYKKMSSDNVGYLLLFVSSFTQSFEAVFNQTIISQRQTFNKQKAILEIAVFEKKLKESKKNLETVLKSLP